MKYFKCQWHYKNSFNNLHLFRPLIMGSDRLKWIAYKKRETSFIGTSFSFAYLQGNLIRNQLCTIIRSWSNNGAWNHPNKHLMNGYIIWNYWSVAIKSVFCYLLTSKITNEQLLDFSRNHVGLYFVHHIAYEWI